MAIGLPASYVAQVDLIGSRRVAREAIVYTFERLGWAVLASEPDLYRAAVHMTGSSWGEKFTVSLTSPGIIEVASACRYPMQVFDWGKNRRNVDDFMAIFAQKERRDAQLLQPESDYVDRSGRSPLDRVLNERASYGEDKAKRATRLLSPRIAR